MEQRPLGKTGLSVSALGFGCGAVGGLMVKGGPDEQVEAVRRALDAGITYFDTAQQYGDGLSETNLGRVLKQLGVRERVVVGTKIRLTPAQLTDPVASIREALRVSLGRLQMEQVDLIQVHNRLGHATDTTGVLDVAELLGAVHDALRAAVADGLTRFAGFTGLGEPDAVVEAAEAGRLDTMQSYFNVLNASSGYTGKSDGAADYKSVIDTAAANGTGVIAIRALAGGALVGTEDRAPNASNMLGGAAMVEGNDYAVDIERARRLQPVVAELGLESSLELGLRFALSKPGISTVMAGLSTLEQLDDVIRWGNRGALDPSSLQRILQAI